MPDYKSDNYANSTASPPVNLDNEVDGGKMRVIIDSTPAIAASVIGEAMVLKNPSSGMKILSIRGIPLVASLDLVSRHVENDATTDTVLEALVVDGDKDGLVVPAGDFLVLKDPSGLGAAVIASAYLEIKFLAGNS